MSRSDPQAMSGIANYAVPAPVCQCGDLAAVHAINTKGMRAVCSASGCDCRRYVASGLQALTPEQSAQLAGELRHA